MKSEHSSNQQNTHLGTFHQLLGSLIELGDHVLCERHALVVVHIKLLHSLTEEGWKREKSQIAELPTSGPAAAANPPQSTHSQGLPQFLESHMGLELVKVTALLDIDLATSVKFLLA